MTIAGGILSNCWRVAKMHLWPSMKIRESFKCAYLQNYERNLRRMNSEKQRLLRREGGGDAEGEAAEGEAGQGRGPPSAIALWGRDLLEVLSCFYCCYAFEDCADQEC